MACLTTLLPANALRNEVGERPSTWVFATCMGDLNGVPWSRNCPDFTCIWGLKKTMKNLLTYS